MILKRLEMQGFKSFADKIIMNFDSGVTGIVGPNGSGKSNVSDAVRWVLGEQSAKQLRGATMADVIFGGTEKRRPQQYCEVSLIFDNSDHSASLDFDEIMITRRVYRNGEGEYYINKAACRLRDVVDLFRDTGVGREGYSIIGQGRIDEILSLKSEDRRNVFEEAAGIVKFKARRTEAERRLAHTNENLLRISDITQELERTLEPLQKQAETARAYQTLSETLKGLELAHFAYSYDAAQTRMNVLRQDIAAQNALAAGQEATLAQNREEEALAAEQIAGIEAELELVREGVLDLTRKVEQAHGQAELYAQQAASVTQELARLAEQKAAAAADLTKLETQKSDVLAAEKAQALHAMEEDVARQERAIEAVAQTLADAEEALEEQKAAMLSEMSRLSDVKPARSRFAAMKETIEKRKAQVISALGQLEEQLPAFDEALAYAKTQEEESQKALADAKRAEKEALDTTEGLRARVANAFAQQEKLSRDHSALQSRLQLLLQMQRDYEGVSDSVRQVLKQAERENNPGIHGVVASLLRVPQELERAVEMALGASAQHVVCTKEADAQHMIEFLRLGRLGRATFLPLSTVRGRSLNQREREALSLPGCLGVASEKIAFDETYRDIIENLLGRTVIAQDLDSAVAIARRAGQAFRLVTLAGDIINPGGAMTGGSVNSRASSLLGRGRQIEQLQKEGEILVAQQKAAAQAVEDLQAKRQSLREQMSALADAVRECDINCARDSERLQRAAERRDAHMAQLIRAKDEIAQLDESLRDVEASLARLGESDAVAENTPHADEVSQATARVSSLRLTLEADREAVMQLRLTCADLQKEIDLLLRDEQHVAAEKERLTALVETLTLREQVLGDALPQHEGAKQSWLEKEAELSGQLSEQNAELSRMNLTRTKALQRQRQLQDEAAHLQAENRACLERVHRLEMQLSRVESDAKAYAERIFEDYELTYEGAARYVTEDFEPKAAGEQIASIKSQIRAMGSVNVNAVEQYREQSARYEELSRQQEDLCKAMDDLNKIIDELNEKMRVQFVEQFALVNESFGKVFSHLFGGGQAELRLADPKDPLNCAIDVVAQPPGKKLQMLSLLSGGERALTAIAILFAMLTVRPAPFCILDEIDAALDEANVANFADFLDDFSQKTQFVVVTHRKGTMERCHGLYGVSMEEKGVSKIVSVKLDTKGE